MLNKEFRPDVIPNIAPTEFSINSTHGQRIFFDSFNIGEVFGTVGALSFIDVFNMGDTIAFTTPLNVIPNRVAASRVTRRVAALRGQTRIQPLHQKAQEFDNKVRQQQGRIPE